MENVKSESVNMEQTGKKKPGRPKGSGKKRGRKPNAKAAVATAPAKKKKGKRMGRPPGAKNKNNGKKRGRPAGSGKVKRRGPSPAMRDLRTFSGSFDAQIASLRDERSKLQDTID